VDKTCVKSCQDITIMESYCWDKICDHNNLMERGPQISRIFFGWKLFYIADFGLVINKTVTYQSVLAHQWSPKKTHMNLLKFKRFRKMSRDACNNGCSTGGFLCTNRFLKTKDSSSVRLQLITCFWFTRWILYRDNKTSLCTWCDEPGKRIQNLESSQHASADKVKFD
jgi:hypothetical protein